LGGSLIAVATLAAASATAQAASTVTAPHPVAAADASSSAESLSASLDSSLRSRAAACYAGITEDSAGIVVHAIGGSACGASIIAADVAAEKHAVLAAAASARMGGTAAPLPAVRYVAAQFSATALEAKRVALTAAAARLQASGVVLSSWGVDVYQNRLVVGLGSDTPATEAAITQALGDSSGVMFQTAGVWNVVDRITDSPPWYGADRIIAPVAPCTSGFSMVSGSQTYNSTAGHCGYGSFTQGGRAFGSTQTWSDINNGDTDAQSILPPSGQAAAGRIWSNLSGSSGGTFPVKGYIPAASQSGGNTVCTSGSYSGDHCDATIYATGQCIHFTDINKTTCGLIVAQSSSYTIQGGDSGGPVFNRGGTTANSGPNAYARGLITGVYSANTSLFAYTPIDYATRALGVSVLAG
jgi:hypothetical protein